MESIGLPSGWASDVSKSTRNSRSKICPGRFSSTVGSKERRPLHSIRDAAVLLRAHPSVCTRIGCPLPGNCFTFLSSSVFECCHSSCSGKVCSRSKLHMKASWLRLNLNKWLDDPLNRERVWRIPSGPLFSTSRMAMHSSRVGCCSHEKWSADYVPQVSNWRAGNLWSSYFPIANVLVRTFVTARKAKPPWILPPSVFREDLPICDDIENSGTVVLSFSTSSLSEDEHFDGQAVKTACSVSRSLRNSSKASLGFFNPSVPNNTEKATSLSSRAGNFELSNSLQNSPFKHFMRTQGADHPTVHSYSEGKPVSSAGKQFPPEAEVGYSKLESAANPRFGIHSSRDYDSSESFSGNSRRHLKSSKRQEPSPIVKTCVTPVNSPDDLSTSSTGVGHSSKSLNSSNRPSKQLSSGSRRLPSGALSSTSVPEKFNSDAGVSDKISQGVSALARNARTGTESSQMLSSSESLDRLHRLLEEQDSRNGSRTTLQGPMRPEELSRLWDRLKEQKQKSVQQIHRRLSLGRKLDREGEEVSLAIEPDSLILGECVVHKRVGVGKYIGTKSEVPPGKKNPVKYIYLKYADGVAKLRAKQAHRLLYRYHLPGEVGRAPTLSKLKDPSLWEKRKYKGKVAIQKMVVNMMDLHVHRLKQSRPCYPFHRVQMAEFASRFPYTPTPDQCQAFADVERDMTQLDLPMDRLICGDVGFGKTEVALRAILIAVLAGKQVMVLTPSTVLAKQQYETIRDRFSGLPGVKVALLCRFQKESEKKELIVGIHDGSLSIVVGTHSLLGSKIRYNNLGLLVIDEEQRFGVKQKVKITCLKTSVDVLTLTATPIPRTLYMAMSGFRDTSLLATPPPERRPIQTHLSEYHQEKAKKAIQFELDRGGQVFYVVPRVKGIEKLQQSLQFQFPDVKVAVAHGKQPAAVLEDAMENFCLGETKILLCTNIIESGLDIHMVNTIIVEDVQHFGLAQLYQLRGRVGRADQEAHAYLFHPNKALLTDEASERLNALRDCCELGQGFQLAERDMAIRGFGSLFGEEQSGDAAKIGTDLYFEMLLDGLSKVDNQRVRQVDYDDIHFEHGVDTHIPGDYINNPDDRESVREIVELAAKESLQALMTSTNRLREKYGREPPSVEMLLKTLYIRRMAADLGIHRIRTEGSSIRMETSMSNDAFEMISSSITSDSIRSFLKFEAGCIKIEGHLGIPKERQLERIFCCLADMCNGLPSFMKYL